MPQIVLSVPRVQQPDAFVPLAPEVAGDAAIVYCPPIGAQGRYVRDGDFGVITGNAAAYSRINVTDAIGEGNAGGLSGGFYPNRHWSGVVLSTQYTVFAVFRDRVGRGATRSLFDADDQTTRAFQFRCESGNTLGFIPFNTGGTPFVWASSNTTSSTGINVAFARLGAGGVGAIFLNGVLTSPGTLTGTPQTACPPVAFAQFAGSSNIVDTPFTDAISIAGIINRALSDAEIRAYTDNPWALFAPTLRPAFFAAGGTVYTASLAESVTAGDSLSAAAALAAALAESATASDVASAAASFAAAMAETATAGDTVSAAKTTAAALSESSTAGDTVSAAVTFAAALAEAASTGDTMAATAVMAAALSEAASALDSIDGAVGAATYSAALSEAASASDAWSAAATLAGALVEAVTAGDALAAVATFAAAVVEVATAADTVTAANTTAAAILEAASAGDTWSASTGAAVLTASLAEAVTAGDLWTALDILARMGVRGALGMQGQIRGRSVQTTRTIRRN